MTYNIDIDPPPELLDNYPAYRALLANDAISESFAKQERIAVDAKRLYTGIGVFSLIATFVTMTALIYAMVVDPHLREQAWFPPVLGCVGALGIAAQLILIFAPLKRRWLGARFAAERVRGIKFQSFQAAAACAGADYEQAVAAFVTRELGQLSADLADPETAMRSFNPERATADSPAAGAPLAPPDLDALKAAYRTLRTDYQGKHAMKKIAELQHARRLPMAISELSFWGAAMFGYLDLVFLLPALSRLGEGWAQQRHFLTLFLFVVSAILYVHERARSFDAALERYEEYRLVMERTSERVDSAKDAGTFIAAVHEAERATMRELKAFCRESDLSTYRF